MVLSENYSQIPENEMPKPFTQTIISGMAWNSPVRIYNKEKTRNLKVFPIKMMRKQRTERKHRKTILFASKKRIKKRKIKMHSCIDQGINHLIKT